MSCRPSHCVQGHSPPTSRPALVACLQLCLLAEMVACTVSVPILTGERHWRPMLVSRAWTVCYLPSCGTEGLQSNRQVHSAERLLRCCCKKQQQPGARGASQLGPIRKRQASQGFKLAAAVPTWGHTLLSHKMPGASVRRSSINLLLKSGWYPVRTCRLPLETLAGLRQQSHSPDLRQQSHSHHAGNTSKLLPPAANSRPLLRQHCDLSLHCFRDEFMLVQYALLCFAKQI